MARTYLDHPSAWPLRPEARQAYLDATELAWADPLRAHLEGRTARHLQEEATRTVAELLGARDDGIVWTSGGTEAVHLAAHGPAMAAAPDGRERRHLVVSAVEHSSVIGAAETLRDRLGYDLTVVGVDGSGQVDPEAVRSALRPDTLSVHLQHANHEVGTLQPTHEVGMLCRDHGVLLHVDACQSVGQLGVTLDQLGADLLSASAVKFGGPGGVGLLAVGPRARIAPLFVGDDRQRRRRAGTVDVPAIAAAAVALRIATDRLDEDRSRREVVRRHLRARLPEAVEDLQLHGPLADAHPGIVACSALYVDGEALVAELDAAGFAVHSGSSCASTSGEPSHVLVAMGALTHGHVRVGIGPETTTADADRFVDAFATVVARLRATSGVRRGPSGSPAGPR